jgi:hypothetical protein
MSPGRRRGFWARDSGVAFWRWQACHTCSSIVQMATSAVLRTARLGTWCLSFRARTAICDGALRMRFDHRDPVQLARHSRDRGADISTALTLIPQGTPLSNDGYHLGTGRRVPLRRPRLYGRRRKRRRTELRTPFKVPGIGIGSAPGHRLPLGHANRPAASDGEEPPADVEGMRTIDPQQPSRKLGSRRSRMR